MKGFEEFIVSFGFKEDPFIVAILCIVVLLVNFAGGLMSNILAAFGGPIKVRKLTARTSFRLVAASEFFFIAYIVYYHTILVTGVGLAQVIYWGFTLIAAPLLAALGAHLMYMAFAKKIEGLKQDFLDFEQSQAQAASGAENGDDEFEEEEADLSEHKGYRR